MTIIPYSILYRIQYCGAVHATIHPLAHCSKKNPRTTSKVRKKSLNLAPFSGTFCTIVHFYSSGDACYIYCTVLYSNNEYRTIAGGLGCVCYEQVNNKGHRDVKIKAGHAIKRSVQHTWSTAATIHGELEVSII